MDVMKNRSSTLRQSSSLIIQATLHTTNRTSNARGLCLATLFGSPHNQHRQQHLEPNHLTNLPSSTAATINSPACQAHSLNQNPSPTRTKLRQRISPTTK